MVVNFVIPDKTGNIILGDENLKKYAKFFSGGLFHKAGKRFGHWVGHYKVCVKFFPIKMYEPYISDYNYR